MRFTSLILFLVLFLSFFVPISFIFCTLNIKSWNRPWLFIVHCTLYIMYAAWICDCDFESVTVTGAHPRGEGVASVFRLPLNKQTQFKHIYTKMIKQQTNVWHWVLNIDGLEKRKKCLSFIYKDFNLSTMEFIYLAMKVLLGPWWTG